jgi:hypothetical protein
MLRIALTTVSDAQGRLTLHPRAAAIARIERPSLRVRYSSILSLKENCLYVFAMATPRYHGVALVS